MKKEIKFIITVFMSAAALICGQGISAQNITEMTEIPAGYELADSVIYRPVTAVDTTLAGKDIFRIMGNGMGGADVKIDQSKLISDSMESHIRSNDKRTMTGYRVRIFFDNKQTARNESEETLKRFNSLYPEVKAYRIYANPYFKVTVGDFRTKSEAMALLTRIKGSFPSAFVVKENIEYPVVDINNAVIIDTVKVMRPKKQSVK